MVIGEKELQERKRIGEKEKLQERKREKLQERELMVIRGKRSGEKEKL